MVAMSDAGPAVTSVGCALYSSCMRMRHGVGTLACSLMMLSTDLPHANYR